MSTDHHHATRGLLWLGILVVSVITLANEGGRLKISPFYDDLQKDEIYDGAAEWRKPPMYESEWRAPRKPTEGRIEFGYDSAYEQMRAREEEFFPRREFELHEPKPSSQFRIKF
jgi:hypothetical protein